MGMEAEAYSGLSDPQYVAAVAVDGDRRHSLLGRHPVVTFLVFAVSPIVSLVVFAIGAVFLSIALARLLGYVDDRGTHVGAAAQAALPYLLTATTIVIPAVILTAVYFGLAERFGIRRRWILVSCLVLSGLAGLAMCDVTLSELSGQSALTFGLGIGSNLWRLCQALAPLAIGLWLMRRGRARGLTASAPT